MSNQTKVGKVRVSTSNYEWAHGRKPRGAGRWAFFPGFREGDTVLQPIWQNGTYSAAKSAAAREAAERGFRFIAVGS